MPKLLTNLNAVNVARITNLPLPVDAGDAVNKAYVDSLLNGLFVKQPVRVASTGNVNIANAPASIDGIALTAGDRVLLKNQTNAAENGIYVFNGAGSALTRATDANDNNKVRPGLYVLATEGTENADTAWLLVTDAPITLGTTELTFVQFSGAAQLVAGDALQKTGNRLDVLVDGTTIQINANNRLTVANTANFANHKYVALIGNGTDVTYTITHNLNTQAVTVSIREVATNQQVIADVTVTGANTLTVTFLEAPSTNAYEVTVIG